MAQPSTSSTGSPEPVPAATLELAPNTTSQPVPASTSVPLPVPVPASVAPASVTDSAQVMKDLPSVPSTLKMQTPSTYYLLRMFYPSNRI